MIPPQFADPVPVPANSGPELELIEMHAVIAEPRLGGRLMKALAVAAPLAGLQHVKRVRKQMGSMPPALHILLCQADWEQQLEAEGDVHDKQQKATTQEDPSTQQPIGVSSTASKQRHQPQLPPAVEEIVRQHGLQVFTAKVPLHAPVTREQLQQWSQHWPLNWRSPDASLLANTVVPSAAEAAAMKRHMAAAWELARQSAAAGGVANACLIVDPKRDVVVAHSVDCTHRHPLQHAAMAAVATAAEWQLRTWPIQQPAAVPAGIGNVTVSGSDEAQQQQLPPPQQQQQACAAANGNASEADSKRRRLEGYADVHDAAESSDQAVQQQEQQQPGFAPDPGCGTACFAAADAGGNPGERRTAVALRDAKQKGQDALRADQIAAAASPGASAGAAQAAVDGNPGPRPYLCTGYDCYLVQEPCAMCAMALVHSRLRRVVYCAPDARYGALGGAYKLHAQRSLNHHYHVYQMPLKNDL